MADHPSDEKRGGYVSSSQAQHHQKLYKKYEEPTQHHHYTKPSSNKTTAEMNDLATMLLQKSQVARSSAQEHHRSGGQPQYNNFMSSTSPANEPSHSSHIQRPMVQLSNFEPKVQIDKLYSPSHHRYTQIASGAGHPESQGVVPAPGSSQSYTTAATATSAKTPAQYLYSSSAQQ